ncbi:MAG: iron-containing alcohol dehydrogenase [Verrucomicrobiota bacterium]|jgi:alcohol dehydrogenase
MAHPDSPVTAFDAPWRTRLVFGPGTLSRLGELAREQGIRRALLVTDPGIVAAGHVERARAILGSSGITVVVFDGVRENPTTLDIDRCLAVARDAGIDGFVGLGGGSSMDTAKGTNFLLTNGGVMKDYWGVGKATQPMLPLLAIPTTAGTGSECQSAALIADEASHRKMACLDPKAAARVALLDPELTLSQPRRVTALTGVDAITHAVEAAVTRRRHPLSSMHAREAFVLLSRHLPTVLHEPGNLPARAAMQLGAAHAGIAIELSMLGAAHAAANPLTARFHVVHGAAVGLMLPAVVRFNASDPASARAYADLAIAAGIAGPHVPVAMAVDLLLATLGRLLDEAGVPAHLHAAQVDPDMIPTLAAEAAQQWTAGFNPRPVGVADFENLYRCAAKGRPQAG